MDLKTLYRSKAVKVVEKPSGLVSTDISDLICHRLDRDTSGCLIIAKSREAKNTVQAQFKKRKVDKRYSALVLGKLDKKRTVEGWMQRSSKNPKLMKMSRSFVRKGSKTSDVVKNKGKNKRFSKTKFLRKKLYFKKFFKNKSQKEFNYISLLKARPITGRKHQIRVHLNWLDYPILGDPWYSSKISQKVSKKLDIERLLLHAQSIEFEDPGRDERVKVESKLPVDFKKIIEELNLKNE